MRLSTDSRFSATRYSTGFPIARSAVMLAVARVTAQHTPENVMSAIVLFSTLSCTINSSPQTPLWPRSSTSGCCKGTLVVMTGDALDTFLTRFARHGLADQVPAQLRPWLLPIEWQPERLWSLDLPRTRLAIEELGWHLQLPWWRHDGRWFAVSPRDVQARPHAYPEHAERIVNADLAFALHVVRRRDRWLVLDGIHRLTKAEILGYEVVEVFTLSASDLAAIASPAEERGLGAGVAPGRAGGRE